MIVGSIQAIIVWLVDGELYCSDANSTAFQFPLVDGKISSRAGTCLLLTNHKSQVFDGGHIG